MARRLRCPDALVLIVALAALALVATWILPAGEFVRESAGGRLRVVPGTYHAVDAARLPWHAFLTRIPAGMARAADVIFFVLIAGGAMGVFRASGAIDAGVAAAIRRFGARPGTLIAGTLLVLSIGAATIGMTEEYVPFVAVLVGMCGALRLDAVVAVALVYVASGIGYAASAHNPFTVLIAQDIAGLELNSGWEWRWLLWAVAIAIGIRYVLRYAARIRAEPSSSLVAGSPEPPVVPPPARAIELRPRHVALLAVLAATVAAFVGGTAKLGWGFEELSASFLALAVVAAAIARIAPDAAAREFGRGAAELTTTALLIGFARAIQVILEEDKVIDTIVDALAGPLASAGPDLAALGMLAVQGAVNLIVPSGSAQANVTMPLMVPLADLTGVTRQAAVLAFQLGDGLTNMVIPTNPVLMAVLALARVPYERWLRFVLPLVAQLALLFALALVVLNRSGI